MKTQNYLNHKRYYIPHHFIFYPVALIIISTCFYFALKDSVNQTLWLMLALSFLFTTLLSLMLRQHYALMNQNRIVRLELRLRYFMLTQKPFDEVENKISLSQLFALRFAPNEELISLIQLVLEKNLSADEIKKSIKNWLPDTMRV